MVVIMPDNEPATPNSSYDFLYAKGQQTKSGRKFELPKLSKPMWLLAISLVVLLLIVILAFVFGRSSFNSQGYVELMSRAQEIVRVSDLAKDQTKNKDTLALISTTKATLSSEKNSIASYLSSNHVKVAPKSLTLYLDKNTDSQMQTAAQNGNVDSVYASYLKDQLSKYLSQLKIVDKVAGAKARVILNDAITSTDFLLADPQLNTTQ